MSYRLRISEIFYSLQGESTLTGLPTVFIRLTGCPLRCQYCDTTYAFKGGETMDAGEILQQVGQYQADYVCVTGGEPLAQKACHKLLTELCDQGYTVSLETSGSIDISKVDHRVIRVMDLKTPGSGELEKNLYNNLQYLNDQDQLKFVICNEEDYRWAKQMLADYALTGCCEILFSAAQGQLPAEQLADWIIHDRLKVRMQVQLHKILWGGGEGR
jgi:7-carboxy-7-deazaguanine synthase